MVHLRPAALARQVDLPKNLGRLLCELFVSSVLSVSDRDTDNTDRTDKTITPAVVGLDLVLVSGLVLEKEKALGALVFPKVSALGSVPGWETGWAREPALELAQDWGLALELAMESDSAQAPVELVAPAQLPDPAPPLDSKLQFPLLPVCVVVCDDLAQRCAQA